MITAESSANPTNTAPTGPSSRTQPSGRSPEDTARPALQLGWVAKGLLFVVIGGLGVELSRRGSTSAEPDQRGALSAIAEAPAGRLAVLAVSVGLLLYALWQAWAAIGRDSDGLLDLAKRLGWAGLAAVYLLLAVTGLRIALAAGGGDGADGAATQSSGPTSPNELTEHLFSVPGGRLLVIGIGLGTAVVGLYHLQKGLRGRFLDDIETGGLDRAHRMMLRIIGTIGFSARAVLLAIAGWLFLDAARRSNPDRAAGLDDSLRTMASLSHGRILLGACGLGLAAAGLYDIVTFRRQRIDDDT